MAEQRVIRALFFGNSYTFRNNLADLVKRLAEAGNPGLTFEFTTVVHGGRTLKHHWEQYRSQDILNLSALSVEDLEKTCDELAKEAKKVDTLPGPQGQDAGRYRGSIRYHREWMITVGDAAPSWDYVVLQSWRDTDGGIQSGYASYARKFADLAQRRGARAILYNTGPAYQNAEPLSAPPDQTPALEETRAVGALGAELNALVVPIPLAIVKCQTARPDVTLRYINDGHPNLQCGYLTGCMFYSALFEKSPVGLAVDSVTDPKIVDRTKPDLGPDGDPRTIVFSDDMLGFLQNTSWESTQAFQHLDS